MGEKFEFEIVNNIKSIEIQCMGEIKSKEGETKGFAL